MSNFEAWIANCHLRQVDGGEYCCQVAVWACYESFRATLEAHVAPLGYSLVWLEEVLPAPQYLARNSAQHRQVGMLLAQAVHPGHTVELGPLHRMANGGVAAEPKSYLTIVDHTFAPPPDPAGIPLWDHEWIVLELKELLFGQPEDGPKMRTYLIVDAALRKNITGVFDLDALDVSVQCLFKGEAANEMKESAPYLIDMTLPDGAWEERSEVPAFHRDFFRKHWRRNTGIFVRTTALMAEVWGHFRKFTRIRMEEDARWVYFRFADPRVISAFVEALHEDDMHQFLGLHQLVRPDDVSIRTYSASHPIGENQRRALPPLLMRNDYLMAFGADRESKFKKTLRPHLEEQSRAFDAMPENEKSDLIDTIIAQAVQAGIKIERAAADFALASILFGRTLASDPQFERIIQSNKNQIDKGRILLREVRFRNSAKVM